MRKKTISQMYIFTIVCNVFAMLCGLGGSIFIICLQDDFVNSLDKIFSMIFTICIFIGSLLFMIMSLRSIVILLKDYKSFKQKKFITIKGVVIGFKKHREPESGYQINDKPIIKVIDTDEEIVLNINDKLIIGETYEFNYLQYSKIAEAKKI